MRKRSAISGQSLTRGAAAPQEIARRSPRVKGQQSATPKLSALSYQLLARGRSRRSLVLNPVFDPEAEPQAQTRREPRTLNPSLAPAFTLTELLVSLVILVGMMTLIATIFATAGKSSGVAQAQARLHRQLLQVADVMSVDLASTFAGRDSSGVPKGVLAIAGVAVEAADTPKSVVRPHRADVLMLLTQQRFEPFIYDPSAHNAVLDDFKQVVYSHADIGKVGPGGQWIGTVKHVENSRIEQWYASEWHLARRVVGFVKTAGNYADTSDWPLVNPSILGTADTADTTDVLRLSAGEILAKMMPGHYVYQRQSDDEMLPSYFYFEDVSCDHKFYWDRSDASYYYLLTAKGSGELPLETHDPRAYWWRSAKQVGLATWWQRTDMADVKEIAERQVSVWPPVDSGYRVPSVVQTGSKKLYYWPRWFYYPAGASGPNDSYRTRIDPMPPPRMPERTAAYFLPSCSEFKVEFTYDDPREIDVDLATGQPVLADTNGDGIVSPPGSGPLDAPAASPVRWQIVPPGEVFVWTGLSTDSNVYPPVGGVNDLRNRTFPYRWPRALRITIRAYAPGGAMDYPIEHSLIHVWD